MTIDDKSHLIVEVNKKDKKSNLKKGIYNVSFQS